jgi:hypothetical protein
LFHFQGWQKNIIARRSTGADPACELVRTRLDSGQGSFMANPPKLSGPSFKRYATVRARQHYFRRDRLPVPPRRVQIRIRGSHKDHKDTKKSRLEPPASHLSRAQQRASSILIRACYQWLQWPHAATNKETKAGEVGMDNLQRFAKQRPASFFSSGPSLASKKNGTGNCLTLLHGSETRLER